MIYLASPYTGTKEEMQQRYEAVLRVTATFIANKCWVYSPIVHCHEMAVRYNLPRDFQFWREYDTDTINAVEEVYVLQLPGWKESHGMRYEMGLAKMCHKPLRYVSVYEESIYVHSDEMASGELIREYALIS